MQSIIKKINLLNFSNKEILDGDIIRFFCNSLAEKELSIDYTGNILNWWLDGCCVYVEVYFFNEDDLDYLKHKLDTALEEIRCNLLVFLDSRELEVTFNSQRNAL